ncbi:MAG TPA: hypothetical protein ENJ28_03005 [Gammaproteobacteria bacterium]|nr:hypothetical protein [Gammaproteobacteria bacterium]
MKNILLFYSFFFLVSCNSQSEFLPQHKYYTWEGLEPDRWSSVWLLKRHIDTSSEISILPVGAQINNAIAIATPKSKVKRTHGFSNYENMVKAYNKSSDAGLIRLGKIINEIEISPWRSSTPAVAVVETQFRALQLKYNRIDVPYDCYAGFFDVLYGVLSEGKTEESEAYLSALNAKLAPDTVCQVTNDTIAVDSEIPVQEYPVDYVLKMIAANKTVVFVDTREDEEFDEHHIPGAVNLKLREVMASSAKQFEDADLVISYCIKDFRGYEVALALSKVGVKNIGIMKPYGLKGWKDLGLPVANSKISDATAIDLLKKRAASGV